MKCVNNIHKGPFKLVSHKPCFICVNCSGRISDNNYALYGKNKHINNLMV